MKNEQHKPNNLFNPKSLELLLGQVVFEDF